VEAAKQGFKSRSQINKDVRSGKLSYTVEHGRKVIELAELIRAYGEPGKPSGTMSPEELTEMSALAPGELTRQALIEEDSDKKDGLIATLQVELREAKDRLKEEMDGSLEERSRLLGLVEAGNKRLEDMREDREQDRKVMEDLTTALNKPLWKKLLGR